MEYGNCTNGWLVNDSPLFGQTFKKKVTNAGTVPGRGQCCCAGWDTIWGSTARMEVEGKDPNWNLLDCSFSQFNIVRQSKDYSDWELLCCLNQAWTLQGQLANLVFSWVWVIYWPLTPIWLHAFIQVNKTIACFWIFVFLSTRENRKHVIRRGRLRGDLLLFLESLSQSQDYHSKDECPSCPAIWMVSRDSKSGK